MTDWFDLFVVKLGVRRLHAQLSPGYVLFQPTFVDLQKFVSGACDGGQLNYRGISAVVLQ